MRLTGKIDALPTVGNSSGGVEKRIVFGPTHFAADEGFVTRCYTAAPGAGDPSALHSHPYAHWIIVHQGVARVIIDGILDEQVTAGSWIHIPAGGVKHTIVNPSQTETLIFFCTVRPEGEAGSTPGAAPAGGGSICS